MPRLAIEHFPNSNNADHSNDPKTPLNSQLSRIQGNILHPGASGVAHEIPVNWIDGIAREVH